MRDKPREILIMQKFYRTYFQENDTDNKLNKQRAKYKVQFSGIRNNKNWNSRGKKVLRNIWKMHSSFFSISLDSSIELSKNITIYLQWNIFSVLLCIFERNWSIYLLLQEEDTRKRSTIHLINLQLIFYSSVHFFLNIWNLCQTNLQNNIQFFLRTSEKCLLWRFCWSIQFCVPQNNVVPTMKKKFPVTKTGKNRILR